MFRRPPAWVVVLLLMGAVPGCTSRWHEADLEKAARNIHRYAEQLAEHDSRRRFRLRIDNVASLPEQTVFLAGAYRHAAGPFRSVLLVSRDGGRSWEETGPAFGVSAIRNLRTLGRRYVWAVATFTGEGCRTPTALLRSTDAGRTWATTDLVGAIEQDQPLFWIKRLDFHDPSHGLMTVTGTEEKIRAYATEDGGKTWRLLWSVRRDQKVEEPGGRSASHPKEVPLWTPEVDMLTITRWVRVRRAKDAWVIEARPIGADAEWAERSRLPMHYRLKDAQPVPIKARP